MTFPFMPIVQPAGVVGEIWQPLVSSVIGSSNLRYNAVNPTGTWIVAGASGIVYSSNDYGNTWTVSNAGTLQLDGAAYGNGQFVVTVDSGDRIYSSTNGTAWTQRVNDSRDNHAVTFNDGYFVVGSGTSSGSGNIYGSSNGTTWTYGAAGIVGSNSVRCGIYVAGKGTFAAGAASGNQRKYVNAVPTAITPWSATPTGIGGDGYAVAWSPTLSRAVLCTSASIYHSSNLTTWTRESSNTIGAMYGVAWCKNQFVAVGPVGTIYTSPDGITWTSRTSGTTNTLLGVSEYEGTILVTGSGGTILRSG
jgi:hypothetical protein